MLHPCGYYLDLLPIVPSSLAWDNEVSGSLDLDPDAAARPTVVWTCCPTGSAQHPHFRIYNPPVSPGLPLLQPDRHISFIEPPPLTQPLLIARQSADPNPTRPAFRFNNSDSMISSEKNTPPGEGRDQPHLVATPIAGLPAELLYHICRLSLDISPTYYTQLSRLLLVCQYWNETLKSFPELWSVLVSPKLWHVEHCLKRSGEHRPLTIQYPRRLKSTQQYERLIHRVCELVHRWSDAAIHIQRSSGPLNRHLSSEAPLLESFDLEVQEAHVEFTRRLIWEPVDLFSGSAPRLRRMTLKGLPANWDSPIFHSLHSLTIGRLPLDVNKLLSMLSARPTLQTLHLDRVELDNELGTGHASGVVEHQLRELHIHAGQSERTVALLTKLYLPNCIKFSHTPGRFRPMGDIPIEEFFNCVLNALPHVLQGHAVHIAHVPDTSVEISSCATSEDENHFQARIHSSYSITDGIRWAATRLPNHRLSIEVYEEAEDLHELTRTRDAIKGVEAIYALTLHTDTGDAKPDGPANVFIRRLWVPKAGGTYTDWPLPNLQRLTLVKRKFDMPGLINMIKARYFTKPSRESSLIFPLHELHFKACLVFDEEWDELAYYIAPGKVTIAS